MYNLVRIFELVIRRVGENLRPFCDIIAHLLKEVSLAKLLVKSKIMLHA